MKIFISWSGPLSRAVATEFYNWIEDVLQLADPWMSEEDIPSGSIWFDGINAELEETGYGIVFVTERNQTAPWLLWEAGALFGGFKDGRRREVVPVLINLGKNDLISPLDKFQAIRAASKKDMLKMLGWINRDLSKSISRPKLEDQLNRCWDNWQQAVERVLKNVSDKGPTGDSCQYTFREAAEKFVRGDQHSRNKYALNWPRRFIDDMTLDQINDEALAPFIEHRRAGTIPMADGMESPKPAAPATLHKEVQLVTRVLKYAKKWGWISHAPYITQLPQDIQRKHYWLTWNEQDQLMAKLPQYLKPVTLFVVNTGVPRGIFSDMEWSWLTKISSLGISMIVLPDDYNRSRYRRMILLNSVAERVIEDQRNKHDRYIFPGKEGGRITVHKAFSGAWKRAKLPVKGGHALGVSTLQWTFEHRLKAAGVPRDIRDYLMWKGEGLKEYGDKPPDYGRLLNYLEGITNRPKENGNGR